MIILEVFVVLTMLFATLVGIAGFIKCMIENERHVALFFASMFFVGILCGYFETGTFSTTKNEYALTQNSIRDMGGYYNITFYAGRQRDNYVSERKEVELIKTNKPEDLCVVFIKNLNAFGTASVKDDVYELELCESLNSGEQ